MIRTRFAPSPTGYLHIGGARTALFSWAFARHHGGQFILRIEDTDLERSTEASVKTILEGMAWLGLDHDEGPFYQMKRLDRYREVVDQLLREGHAYYCYASREELDVMREAQRARGEKPRYDGRWRDSKETPPAGVKPVIRFRNPTEGEVTFVDLVKGSVTVANSELDDLVLMRADGVPTYNFGVVVDDLDMNITHVIRGDDHVNNTPRQINIMKALGATIPQYAHVPMILGEDGQLLSKRHGAVSVTEYRDEGYLPEAVVNYLARLGWSHGDQELFSRDQLIEWFDLDHVNRSAARFNREKLDWINQNHIKTAKASRLAELLNPLLEKEGVNPAQGPDLERVADLLRDRATRLTEMVKEALIFYRQDEPAADLKAQHFTSVSLPVLKTLGERFATVTWQAPELGALVKAVAAEAGVKMGQVGMPLRLALFGTTHTPSIDATLELLGREEALRRLAKSVG